MRTQASGIRPFQRAGTTLNRWRQEVLKSTTSKIYPPDFGGLRHALLAWNHRYESWRLHQALGYLTPNQFYQQWLSNQPQRKEAVSGMP